MTKSKSPNKMLNRWMIVSNTSNLKSNFQRVIALCLTGEATVLTSSKRIAKNKLVLRETILNSWVRISTKATRQEELFQSYRLSYINRIIKSSWRNRRIRLSWIIITIITIILIGQRLISKIKLFKMMFNTIKQEKEHLRQHPARF